MNAIFNLPNRIGTGLVSLVLAWLAILGLQSAFSEEANTVKWESKEEGFAVAAKQTWHLPPGGKTSRFGFSAVRFHLGYFELRLLGIEEFSKTHRDKLTKSQNIDASLFDLGLKAVYTVNPFNRPIRAVAPAGFLASERKPVNLGLLKVNGKTFSSLLDDGPSAVFCLQSPNPQFADAPFQVPIFYRLNDDRFAKCSSAVQVGPRILEDPNATKKPPNTITYVRKDNKGKDDSRTIYLGIPERSANSSPFFRTVFAVDDPGREEKEAKKNARNGYLIVTQTSVTLWDIQHMLTSPAFYSNEHFAPHWALNLVGGDYAGLIIGGRPDPYIGNVDVTQASVLAVVPRN
jgi:hypothetical protein